jgi:hypothetical protein
MNSVHWLLILLWLHSLQSWQFTLPKFRTHSKKLNAKPKSQLDVFYPQFSNRLLPLSVEGALQTICQNEAQCPKFLLPRSISLPEKNIPTVNRFLLANPKTFLLNENIAKAFGCDFERLALIFRKFVDKSSKFKYYLEHSSELGNDLALLAHILPIIYIAELTEEDGMVGYQINSPSYREPESEEDEYETDEMEGTNDEMADLFATKKTTEEEKRREEQEERQRIMELTQEQLMNPETFGDILPFLKGFREKQLYLGGHEKKGASLTMLHTDPNLPGSKEFPQILSHQSTHRLFQSSEFAFAHDEVLTGDKPLDQFKFFHRSTMITKEQIDSQVKNGLWIVFDAPLSVSVIL